MRKSEVAGMKKINLSKTSRRSALTYAAVIAAYLVLQSISAGGGLSCSKEQDLKRLILPRHNAFHGEMHYPFPVH